MARGDGVLGQQGKGQCVSGFCVAGCVAGCGKVLCMCLGFVWLVVWLVELPADQQCEDRIVVFVQVFPKSCSESGSGNRI